MADLRHLQHDDHASQARFAQTEATPAARASAEQRQTDSVSIEQAQLVRLAKAGDRDALGKLLAAQESRLFAICLRMVSDREAARDLTHDALVSAIQSLDSFDERARFSTWITRIAMNACISHLRKRKLRQHASLDGSTADRAADAPAAWVEQRREQTPGSSVETSEALASLRLAMSALPEDQRALLLLRDGQGMDYASIAQTLDLRLGTVKSRLFRARAALREAMQQLEPESEKIHPAPSDVDSGSSDEGGAA